MKAESATVRALGREIEGTMAIIILGGLVTSTALNFLVTDTSPCDTESLSRFLRRHHE